MSPRFPIVDSDALPIVMLLLIVMEAAVPYEWRR